ncbi:AAA family ATPase [Candidatus Mycobacterium wuenschmannii]|uniref:AAA family ATPase n=1 Tax=Candidatus Mycobacterium wuenschmannii TaxID=3027808 RepID=A0ABY8W1P8_9MYCO|nr:AAA family ATPase [Candidatus Mycobacterium wuenschmannii]WIM89805.1 AAA family ATPase [Candidatus Mycobacterium wuenschmannii]
MKLHRLVLKNYRGIDHREIDFPDHGVVVVSGANEVGKSSMVEALDLLLESKDRSTRKEVKQVKPTHADVGSEITAEISAGAYRFIYHKRFHKKPETQLTVLEPRREQHSGDEAHDRVQAMLAETVDTELWHAQRVLQSAATDAVNLSGCDALTRALDVAAGDTAALSGNEPLLIERIDSEFARYFTPTGRPTGEWTVAIKALDAATQEVERCAAAVAEVDDRVQRHAVLTLELAELAERRAVAATRHAAAQAAADAIARLTEQVREAELIAAAATAESAASTAEHAERVRLRGENDSRSAAVAGLTDEAREATEAQALARDVTVDADAAVEQADLGMVAARERADGARQQVDDLARREETQRLTGKLAKIDAALRERDAVAAELSVITVTEDLLRQIEQAAASVDRAEGQLALVSATVEFVAIADLELVAGDQRVSLAAGESWSTVANSATEVQIPGVVTTRVTPGASALEIQEKFAAAQGNLTEALTAAKISDLDAARQADQRRRELQSLRDQLTATLAGLTGDDDVEELRARLAELQDLPAVSDDIDAAAARAELLEAVAARAQAEVDCDTHRKVAALALKKLNDVTAQATRLHDKLVTQRAELVTVADRLAEQRASVADEQLAAAVDAHAAAAQAATGRVAELSRELAAKVPDAVAAELADAVEETTGLRQRIGEVERTLHEIAAQLAVFGTEGRQGKLDAAEIDAEHARGEHDRVGRRARAVQLLRTVMTRHRDTTRLRYVEPFRAELERLGRPVFGPSFEVDIDSDLCILTRTLAGRTVPYESLSGGAKEQLGILARLAGAALVAKEDAVPILIDDALGFTDPERLVKMAAVFDTLGERGQVIVLTCTPARYDGVKDARRIELCA